MMSVLDWSRTMKKTQNTASYCFRVVRFCLVSINLTANSCTADECNEKEWSYELSFDRKLAGHRGATLNQP